MLELQNRILSIEGMSPRFSYHSILQKIRQVGKIFSVHLIRPSILGKDTTLANVVMWDWPSTRRLIMQVEDGILNRDGFEPEAKLISNWFKMPVHPSSHHSRVLLVQGDPTYVTQGSIVGFLRETLEFELDEVIVTRPHPDVAGLEIRFVSYQSQAELAYEKLNANRHKLGVHVAEFGRDPCDLV